MSIHECKSGRKLLTGSCALHSIPNRVSPFLAKLMDSYIGTLIKLGGPDINYGLTEPLRLYYRINETEPLASNWRQFIPADSPKYFKSSVARRLALTKVFRRAVCKCLGRLATADVHSNNRMYGCPPIGMNLNSWKCRSLFCPNCRMRLANSTWRFLRTKYEGQAFEAVPAALLKLDFPFIESRFGYTPVLDESIVRRLSNRLAEVNYFGCKTLGAQVLDGKPATSIRIALFSDAKDMQFIQEQMTKLQKYMRKNSPEILVSAECREGLDNICLELYDAGPLCLTALSDEGFQSNFVQHTTEEFKYMLARKKKVSFFGTGV